MKQLEDYRWYAWNCFRDSMCKSVFTWHVKSERYADICPSVTRYKFDAYSAQGRLDVARAVLEGELDWSDDLLDVVYKCQLCGACDYICGRIKEMQPGKVIQALRAKLVSDGKAPPPELKAVIDSLEEYSNPYQKPNSVRANWVKELYSDIDSEEETVFQNDTDNEKMVLFVGCMPLKQSKQDIY